MASSQVLLKFAGQYSSTHIGFVDGFIENIWLWFALCASVGGIVFWLMTLRRLPISAAYPWTALIYLITPVASVVFFDEIFTGRYVFGLTLILIGVILTTRGVISQ